MKKPRIVLLGIAVLLTTFSFLTFRFDWLAKDSDTKEMHEKKELAENEAREEEGESEREEEEEESGADKQLTSWFQAKAYPDPWYLDDKYRRAWDQFKELRNASMRTSRTTAGNWSRLPQVSNIGGRILTVAIDPANGNNLWAGSASGGLWRSTDMGNNWTSVTTDFPILGVTSILIHPTNSQIMYIGTGEVYRVDTSNIGFNVWKARGTYGIGVLKTTDGGASWSNVLIRSYPAMFGIQAMKFDPTNPNTIYVCGTDGLYRSTNAGANWTQIFNSAVYVKDICINPTNNNQIVISTGNMTNLNKGIWRTTNGTNASPTWTKITSGLPASFEGSIHLDNNAAGSLLVASIGINSLGSAADREIYSSANFGQTWTVVGGTTAATTTNHCDIQFWFAHDVAINPYTDDSLTFAGVNWYRYRISNTTRTTIGGGVHSDVHEIKYDPAVRGRIYVACDGGLYRSVNGGANWTRINNGLEATQFYASIGVSTVAGSQMLVGGLQDNGQVVFNGTTWSTISYAGGDGAASGIQPGNNNRFLVSRDAKAVYLTTNGGGSGSQVMSYWGFAADSRTGFNAPLVYSRSTPTTVYVGSDNLHKSTDGGSTWTNNTTAAGAGGATNYIDAFRKTAITLCVAPTNANVVYASTSPFAQYDNDANNLYVTGVPNVLRTTTGNTPFSSAKGTIPNRLPDRFIMDFAVSTGSVDSVFAAVGGFGTPHVYVSGDGGANWFARSTGLPDVPFNAILIDPVNPKIIYAACDLGVYVSANRGVTWVDFNNGLSDATLVMDLQISDGRLIAATHGKGVWRSDLFVASGLPVQLEDFWGANRGPNNELKWRVSQEVNFSHYELQRSSDGVHFTTIANVNGTNTQIQKTYTYNDPIPTNTATMYYYRLRMINLNNTYEYSDVVVIRTSSKGQFTILGNPFKDKIAFQYNIDPNQELEIRLFDVKGRLIRIDGVNTMSSGSGTYEMNNLTALPSGTYVLQLTSRKEKWSFKIVKRI